MINFISGHGIRPACVMAPPPSDNQSDRGSSVIRYVLPKEWQKKVYSLRRSIGCAPQQLANVQSVSIDNTQGPSVVYFQIEELYLCRQRCSGMGIDPAFTPILWLLILCTFMVATNYQSQGTHRFSDIRVESSATTTRRGPF